MDQMGQFFSQRQA